MDDGEADEDDVFDDEDDDAYVDEVNGDGDEDELIKDQEMNHRDH